MGFRDACKRHAAEARRITEYEREQMRYEPRPDVWLARRREAQRERVSEFVGGAVIFAVSVAAIAIWLKAEGWL